MQPWIEEVWGKQHIINANTILTELKTKTSIGIKCKNFVPFHHNHVVKEA